MSSKELRKQLIEKIESLEDDKILEEVYRILEVGTQEVDVITLSPNQKSKIDKGLQDIEGGRFLTNDEANRDIDEWLKK